MHHGEKARRECVFASSTSLPTFLFLCHSSFPYHKGDSAPGPSRLVSVCLAFDANLQRKPFLSPCQTRGVEYEHIPSSHRGWGLKHPVLGTSQCTLPDRSLLTHITEGDYLENLTKCSAILEFHVRRCSERRHGFVSCLLGLIIDRSPKAAGTLTQQFCSKQWSCVSA